jgi:TonB-dependent SusC/RagA subfamily outer membrane receptor
MKRPGILSFFILLLICGRADAQNDSLPSVSLPGGPVTVKEITDRIRSGTGMFLFFWNQPSLMDRVVITKKETITIPKALDLFFPGQEYDYSVEGHTYIIKVRPADYKDSRSHPIKIVVTDEAGQALPAASLHLTSAGKMFTTGRDGTAILDVRKFPDTLTCAYAGMRTETRKIVQDSLILVSMRPCTEFLDEIVVRSYVAANTAVHSTGSYSRVHNNVFERQIIPGGLSALTGRVAGMLVTRSSGEHGAITSMLIRGKNSILNGNDPLIIIDGVPFGPGNRSVSNITTGNAAGSLSPLSFLDMASIESVQILRDADATGTWGPRGANGVVLITTRCGTPGKPRFDISLSTGASLVTTRPRLMNTRQYVAMRREALANDGSAPDSMNAPDLVGWDTTRSIDWGRYIIGGVGSATNMHLSLTGGKEGTNYALGIYQRHETDVFPTHPAHDLSTFTGHLDHHAFDGRLAITANGLLGLDRNRQFFFDATPYQFSPPNLTAIVFGDPSYIARSCNALAGVESVYQLNSHLSIRNNIGYSNVTVAEQSEIQGRGNSPPGSNGFFASSTYRSWILQPQLEFQHHAGKWNIGLSAGVSWQHLHSHWITWSAMDIIDAPTANDLHRIGFTRLNLRWKDRFILNITGSRDGSTRIGSARQSRNFGAAGLAWVFSSQPAFQRLLPFINFGKIRTSYGVTGNDQLMYAYNNADQTKHNGDVGEPTNWEATVKQEAALELGLFRNRLTFTTAWYRNHSLNQVLPVGYSMIGEVTISNRAVVVSNTGWEFSLASSVINDRNFKWSTSVNVSLPVNKLLSFPGLARTPYANTLTLGQSITSIRAFRYLGVDKSTGLFRFSDVNGDERLTNDDRVVVGNSDPRLFGGLDNTFTWHNWELSVLVEGRVQKGQNYQTALYASTFTGSFGMFSNQTTDLLNRWRRPGDVAAYQRLTSKVSSAAGRAVYAYLNSSAQLTNESFVRLKSFSLAYRFPEPAMRKMGLHQLTFFVEGEDLLTWTPYKGVDPEIQSAFILPPARTVLAGVKVKF